MLEAALNSREPRGWGFPVLFAYRHTLELYLKIISEIDDHTHSLRECVLLVEKRHGERLVAAVAPGGLRVYLAQDMIASCEVTLSCLLSFRQRQSQR
jgi:hypothetical protein